MSRWIHTAFDFFASLKLAIFLLASLIAVFAAGTILESLHGAETAKIRVYDTAWMAALLVLLAVNLAASAFSRWPWQKKHAGFVLTHLGIILILAGSFVTKHGMLDSQMPVEKGKTEYRVFIDQPVIYLRQEAAESSGVEHWQLPLKRRAFAWTGSEILAGERPLPFSLRLMAHYPKGRLHEDIEAAPQGPAALHLALDNDFVHQEQWLLEGDENLAAVQMGPVHLALDRQPLARDAADAAEEDPYLEFRWPDKVLQISLKPDLKLPADLELKGSWRVRVEAVYQNAMIDGGRLTEQGGGALNPAVVLWLEDKRAAAAAAPEKHTVFAKYPDFPTQHGMQPSASGARIFYRLPGGGSGNKSYELRFVPQSDGSLLFQKLSGAEFQEGRAAVGEKVATGWMGLVFSVKQFYPQAQRRKYFTPEPNTSQSKQAFRAAAVEIASGAKTRQIWLGQEMPEAFEWEGRRYRIVLGQLQKPLGFKLTLNDFRVEEYPGTDRPAAFESDVTLRDDFRGVRQEATISMNKPLIYHGLRIFQASYSRAPGQPDVSVFAVARDPGIGIKYAGALVMVAGILTMFYTRRFSTSKGIE